MFRAAEGGAEGVMGRFSVGQPVRRKEDVRLVTGRGTYTDDVAPAGQLTALFLRSPHAHAEIRRLDATAARAMPGVALVLTGEDLAAAGLGPMPCKALTAHRDGRAMAAPERPVLARGRVRFVGDPVALVVAASAGAARDALEAIEVEFAELPAVIETMAALAPGAPQLWPEAPGNLALDWEMGDGGLADRLLAAAHHVTTIEIVNNRVAPSSMEARGCLAEYDAASDRLILRTGGQGVHGMQAILAEDILRIDKAKLRVIQADVGGGFGMKIWVYPEYAACLHAARTLQAPVKWVSERGEAFLSDTHGRDHVTRVRIATDADGRMTALKAETTANLGAYLGQFGPFIPTAAGARMYAGVYAFQAVHYHVRCAFTNTAPVDAYRGAGRPEAAYAVERAVDATARELGLDPAEFRRRNFIPPEAMPYRTAMDTTYDTGEFARLMDAALDKADVSGFAARRLARRAEGRLAGLGIAYYVEQCSGGGDESARVELAADGTVRLLIGTQTNGQGHATAYSQILVDALGVEFDAIEVVQGDTDLVASGRGTGGSRSVPVGGAATLQAARALVEKAKRVAADMLEAAEADIGFADGRFSVVGTDRRVGLAEVARRAGGLEASEAWKPPIHTFPNGCHVCELSIDIATGIPLIERYTVVDDFGKVLNPLLVAGQVHGGIVQGLGQALLEEAVYDPASGQLVTGSFMDYCMPRAEDVPDIDFSWIEVPSTTNLLGMKGAGEAGSIGAPPAIMNAIVDALAESGVTNVDMPATPQKLWRLIRDHVVAPELRAAE
jgi:carbon-monoxide dehydrogenase large subunit